MLSNHKGKDDLDFDLSFIDLNSISEIGIYNKIKNDYPFIKSIIFLIDSYKSEIFIPAIEKTGFSLYLLKPFTPYILYNFIIEILQIKRKQNEN